MESKEDPQVQSQACKIGGIAIQAMSVILEKLSNEDFWLAYLQLYC